MKQCHYQSKTQLAQTMLQWPKVPIKTNKIPVNHTNKIDVKCVWHFKLVTSDKFVHHISITHQGSSISAKHGILSEICADELGLYWHSISILINCKSSFHHNTVTPCTTIILDPSPMYQSIAAIWTHILWDNSGKTEKVNSTFLSTLS